MGNKNKWGRKEAGISIASLRYDTRAINRRHDNIKPHKKAATGERSAGNIPV
jgi:hypothetical protein